MFVKSTRFKQVCQLLLSLIVAAENLKAFLAILVLTFGSIKLCFAFLVPAL